MRWEWWAWTDLNSRPRPYQRRVVRFYNNLQDRGDCQNTRKSCRTSHFVGWTVGSKKFTNSKQPHVHLLAPRFGITSVWRTTRPELSDELERYTILAVRLVH